MLLQYCHLRNIKIEKIYVEDYSAKTFNRPEWKKLMLEIEAASIKPSLVLFTRWDRFSRNTGDAYYVIKSLKKLGVEPQAIEQPLDLSIPENKMMFAFYLAIPEVENDRRSLNTKTGMQRAKQRGKWLGKVPIGYRNHHLPDGSRLIMPKEPEAGIIQHAFYRLANLRCNITDAYLMAAKEGIQCSRSNFWKMLRNPIYAGNIVINDDSSSKKYLIPGLHKAIVSTPTFNKVQELFYKQKRGLNSIRRNTRHVEYLLKSFVRCPRCSKLLTASSSSGRSQLYRYYHCHYKCGYRIRCEKLHTKLLETLKDLKPGYRYAEEFRELIASNYQSENRKLNLKKTRNMQSIELFTERIYKTKNLLLDGHLEFQQYADIKFDLEAKIRMMGYTIETISKNQVELSAKVEQASKLIDQVHKFMTMLDDQNKHAFVNLIINKNEDWEHDNLNHVFKKPFRIVFGIEVEDGDMETRNAGEISSFLKQLADMELLITD